MSPKFHKFKLLLDENMPARRKFERLNRLFDVKHIAFDLRKGGLLFLITLAGTIYFILIA